MTKINSILKNSAFLLALTILGGSVVRAASERNVPEYNLQSGMGLKGYDPVAVFPEGGGQSTLGNPQLHLDYMGVVYSFASPEHMAMFEQNPAKYEPTYGGWCAYAMSSGSKVDIQPQLFTIHGNRAHYFVGARAKQNFDRELADHESKADANWKQISGEDPRF